jgi:hypothetical protein
MKKHLYLLCSILIIVVAMFLRLKDYTHRAPFDWDQNRDFTEVSRIAVGKFTMIGPVAKGEGGFFLGPLYYYIETPFYTASHGNPASLPLASILCDVLAVVAILYLFPTRLGKLGSLAIAALWSVSWFAVEGSHIAWNVSMIPLWTVLFLFFVSEPKKLSPLSMLTFGIVTGLTWHVHAALIPLALFLGIARWRDIVSFKYIVLFFAGYAIPLIPLALFDIRHAGMQRYLMMQYLEASQTVKGSWGSVVPAVVSRLGKNTYGILFGSSDLHLIWGVATLVVAVAGIFHSPKIGQAAGWMVLVNTFLTILLREPGLPEYYLAASYIPTLILVVCAASHFRKIRMQLVVALVSVCIFFNLRSFTTVPTSFSLSQKINLARTIVISQSPVALHTDLPFGRDSGIASLVRVYGGSIRDDGKPSYLVTDKTDESVFYGGELYETMEWYGGMRLARHE